MAARAILIRSALRSCEAQHLESIAGLESRIVQLITEPRYRAQTSADSAAPPHLRGIDLAQAGVTVDQRRRERFDRWTMIIRNESNAETLRWIGRQAERDASPVT